MYRILIFSCLWHLSLSEQNTTDFRIPDSFDHNGNITIKRLSRASSSRPRGEKPVDCHKLHGTDDSAFVAIILNKYSGRFLCMGSIIDDRHILTANPCVLNIDVPNLRVLLGYFKAWWGRHSYVHYVEKVLKHEHDLVILRLSRMITFSRTVRPIRLLRLEDGEPDPPPAAAPASVLLTNQLNIDESGSNLTVPNEEQPKPAEEDNIIAGIDVKEQPTHAEEDIRIAGVDVKEQPAHAEEDIIIAGIDDTGESKNENNKAETKGKHNHTDAQMNVNEDDKDSNRNKNSNKADQGNVNKKSSKEKYKEGERDPEGSEVEVLNPQTGSKIYRSKKRKKITKREVRKFMEKHPKVKNVLLVGFPLSRFDVQGEPISQTIIYSMKEEEVKPADTCVNIYHLSPLPKDDETNKETRDFCTPGTSKLCWGCLGGPALFKKDNEYIQVGVVGGAQCDDDKAPTPYLHIRVDVHMNWILANSLIPPKL